MSSFWHMILSRMFPLSKSEILYGVRGGGCYHPYHQIESVPKLFPQVNTVPGVCLCKWNQQLNFKDEMEMKACLESSRRKIPEPAPFSWSLWMIFGALFLWPFKATISWASYMRPNYARQYKELQQGAQSGWVSLSFRAWLSCSRILKGVGHTWFLVLAWQDF